MSIGFNFMKPRIAVPITARKVINVYTDMGKAVERGANILELRTDFIEDLTSRDLEKMIDYLPDIPKIITNRHEAEGGKCKYEEAKRISLLQEAIKLGAQYVDIEAEHFYPLNKESTKIILSSHNNAFTPENLQGHFNKVRRKAEKEGADIVKIATTANYCEDSLKMLNVIAYAAAYGVDFIGLCMGEKGKLTRIWGPVFGNYLTFACLSHAKQSANGQMTIYELKEAWRYSGIKFD
jgi:3-dehydroquinate dehydratase type I